jgi:lysophospholipase L1-like esterase
VLLLGDSTGVGVGAEAAAETLPGLLAAEFPGIEIVNACSSGARVVDTLAQLRAQLRPNEPFDLALVMAGGNDVLKLTTSRDLMTQAQALLSELLPRARQVVWLGSADIGTAPALKPPLNWVFGGLCRHRMKLLGLAVTAAGAEFIDFCAIRHSRMFTDQPQRYFAADGLHPTAASYRHCFEELKRRAPLVALLTRPPLSAGNVWRDAA